MVVVLRLLPVQSGKQLWKKSYILLMDTRPVQDDLLAFIQAVNTDLGEVLRYDNFGDSRRYRTGLHVRRACHRQAQPQCVKGQVHYYRISFFGFIFSPHPGTVSLKRYIHNSFGRLQRRPFYFREIYHLRIPRLTGGQGR